MTEDELPQSLHEKCLTQIRRKTPNRSRIGIGMGSEKVKIPQYIVLEAVFEYLMNLKEKTCELGPMKNVADIEIQTDIQLCDNVSTQTVYETVESGMQTFYKQLSTSCCQTENPSISE